MRLGKDNRIGWIATLISLASFLIIWYIASSSGLVNKTLFPSPTEVLDSFIELAKSGELVLHTRSSLWRVILGLAIGSISGITIGLLTGRNLLIDDFLSPILNVFRSFPPVAIIPLVIVWMGVGETAKLFSISFAVFFPVWVNAHTGAANIPQHYLQAASTLTDSNIKVWYKIILPSSLSFIIAGVRTGIAIAFIMVFVSELAGSSSGIGYLISVSHLAYRIDRMIVGLFLLGFYGTLTDYVLRLSVRRFYPWAGKI